MLLHLLDLIGVAVFAMSDALAASCGRAGRTGSRTEMFEERQKPRCGVSIGDDDARD